MTKKNTCSISLKILKYFQSRKEPTPFAQHWIDTDSHAPISVYPHIIIPANKEKLNLELDKLFQDGNIEVCDSAWSAAVVLVAKRDGSTRLCVHFLPQMI